MALQVLHQLIKRSTNWLDLTSGSLPHRIPLRNTYRWEKRFTFFCRNQVGHLL